MADCCGLIRLLCPQWAIHSREGQDCPPIRSQSQGLSANQSSSWSAWRQQYHAVLARLITISKHWIFPTFYSPLNLTSFTFRVLFQSRIMKCGFALEQYFFLSTTFLSLYRSHFSLPSPSPVVSSIQCFGPCWVGHSYVRARLQGVTAWPGTSPSNSPLLLTNMESNSQLHTRAI